MAFARDFGLRDQTMEENSCCFLQRNCLSALLDFLSSAAMWLLLENSLMLFLIASTLTMRYRYTDLEPSTCSVYLCYLRCFEER
jgi:hypothetical protein